VQLAVACRRGLGGRRRPVLARQDRKQPGSTQGEHNLRWPGLQGRLDTSEVRYYLYVQELGTAAARVRVYGLLEDQTYLSELRRKAGGNIRER